jgi:hypothetical protein
MKPSTSMVSCRQSCRVCATSGWSGISRSPTRFSAQAIWSGNTTVSRSSASERWNCGGTLRPPFMRRTASDAVAFQRQRVPNIGASSSACTSTSRALADFR